MNQSNKAVDVLITSVLGATDRKISVAPYDKTIQCIVSEKKNNNNYLVTSRDKVYSIKTNLVLNIGESINLVFAQNNPNNAIIIPNTFVQKLVFTNPELITENGICVWECVHNKNTTDVQATMIEISSGKIIYNADIKIITSNSVMVKIESVSNLKPNTYKLIII